MKVQLVDEWKSAWKWFSVQSMVLAGSIQGTWLAVPADLKTKVPESWVQGVVISLLVLGTIGRLVKQDKQDKAE